MPDLLCSVAGQPLLVAFLGDWDVGAVPVLPAARLVPGDQQDCLPLGVEDEQDPHLCASGRSGAQFLHVVPGAALDPVDHRPPERRPLRCEQVDGCGDEFGGRAVETQEPLADLVEQHHLPHARIL
jgi:hypothetical protein